MIRLPQERLEYKEARTKQRLNKLKGKNLKRADIGERFILEQKLYKMRAPEEYAKLKEEYYVDVLAERYRKNYGKRGVTYFVSALATDSGLKNFIKIIKNFLYNNIKSVGKKKYYKSVGLFLTKEEYKLYKEKNKIKPTTVPKVVKKYYKSVGLFLTKEEYESYKEKAKIKPITVPKEETKYYDSIGLFLTRKEYKLHKAKEAIQSIPEPDLFDFANNGNAIIAQLKLYKDKIPQKYLEFQKTFKVKHNLRRKQKIYGQQGVTELASKFVKSMSFIKFITELENIASKLH